MTKWFCPNQSCGEEVEENSIRCHMCGTNLDRTPPEEVDILEEIINKKHINSSKSKTLNETAPPKPLQAKADLAEEPFHLSSNGGVGLLEEPSTLASTKKSFDPRYDSDGTSPTWDGIEEKPSFLTQFISYFKNILWK
tara:strand:+ start:7712 stop:8125 length:414 start_codon:yes stop_codon:yes gene_type:complete